MNHIRNKVRCDVAHKKGITGKGITVAILDSGAILHQDYKNRIVAFQDFYGIRKTIYDDYGHGTHVTGILGGNGTASGGQFCGIAPECNLVIGKVLNEAGEGNAENLIAGMEWVMKNKNRLEIRVLNISLGFVDPSDIEKKTRILNVTKEAWKTGLVVVAAAGNEGPREESVTAPGMLREVITVGCYGECSRYSGRGSMQNHLLKPDIVAPGTSVVSCSAESPHCYSKMSGTSMSTPIVAGACALLLSQNPTLTNNEVKRRILRATDDCGLPRTWQGHGILNLQKLRF